MTDIPRLTELADLDREKLRSACFTLARAVKWARGPVDVRKIEDLARQIEASAYVSALYLKGQERDPNIVVRAIEYLTHHHGEPFDCGGISIEQMLYVLIELACPNTQPIKASSLFYDDIEQGIREAKARAVD